MNPLLPLGEGWDEEDTKKSIYKKGFDDVKTVPISFEFFPTKTDAGAEKLKVVHQELQLLNPEFFSITYGAGGSTRERTLLPLLNSMVKVHLLPLTYLVLAMTKHVLQSYSTFIKIKALTVLWRCVVTYLQVKLA
jgi:uncharacterized SAM-dependent methyltransferase